MIVYQIFVLILLAVGVSIASIAATAWNIIQAMQFFTAASQNKQLADAPKSAWVLSILACFVGPLSLVLALVALVMGCVQARRCRRNSSIVQEAAILPHLAILNSSMLLAFCILFGAWTLWFAL